MVGPEGRRVLQRGARRRLVQPQGQPFAVEGDKIELREDPHKASRERGRPRLRTLAPEHGLKGLTAGLPRRSLIGVAFAVRSRAPYLVDSLTLSRIAQRSIVAMSRSA